MELLIDDYDNTYNLLNSHLYNNNKIVYHIDINPPIILTINEDKKKVFIEEIKKKWSISDQYFEKHKKYYIGNKVILKCFNKNMKYIINVNYHPFGSTYYHALTEVIPNILFILNEINDINLELYIPKSNFIIDLLNWFEIKNPYFFKNENEIYISNQIIQKHTYCGHISPESIEYMNKIIEKKLQFEKKKGIFIHRRETTRNIINSIELFEYIKNKFSDIEWYFFDVENIEDTANIFSKAKIIIGPHGAGLTNMLFSPRNIKIFEIMPFYESNMCYNDLSKNLCNDHYIYPVNYCNENKQMEVNCDEFINILSKIL